MSKEWFVNVQAHVEGRAIDYQVTVDAADETEALAVAAARVRVELQTKAVQWAWVSWPELRLGSSPPDKEVRSKRANPFLAREMGKSWNLTRRDYEA